MKKIYWISGLLILILMAAGISYFIIRDQNGTVPKNITLVNQNGENYTFGEDHTQLKLVEFIYTHCPKVCPTTTLKMSKLQKDLQKSGVYGKKIKFITITIDPYQDTPDVLKNYMSGFNINNDGSWVFLSGYKKNTKEVQKKIREVANSLQFQYKDPGDGFFIHSSFTYLLNENNKFIMKFPMGDNFNEKDVYKKIMDELN